VAVNIISAFQDSRREDWYTAGKWLAFTVGAGFLPLIVGSLLVLALSQKAITWLDFIVHGEFALYSATLVAGSARLVSKDKVEAGPFVHREMFIWVAMVITTLSVTVYSLIKAATFLSAPSAVNNTFIVGFTLPLFFISLIFGFIVMLLDNQRFNVTYVAGVKREERALEEKLDELPQGDLPQVEVEEVTPDEPIEAEPVGGDHGNQPG
jgi:hypothetical protein